MTDRLETFRRRLLAHDPLIGTFTKTPSPLVAEVLALSSLDVIALDGEHAPFGHLDADLCIGTLRAAGMPSLVRVADDCITFAVVVKGAMLGEFGGQPGFITTQGVDLIADAEGLVLESSHASQTPLVAYDVVPRKGHAGMAEW